MSECVHACVRSVTIVSFFIVQIRLNDILVCIQNIY